MAQIANKPTDKDWLEGSSWSDDCICAPWYIEIDVSIRMKKYVEELLAQSSKTPDAAALNVHNEQLLFVYGSLKRGFEAEDILGGAKFLGRGWTKLSYYRLLYTSEFPAAVFDTISKDSKAVAGEVFLIPTSIIKDLDQYESNGTLFRRRKMGVDLEDGSSRVCWMYLANADNFRAITTLCPSYKRKKNGQEYYSYIKPVKKGGK